MGCTCAHGTKLRASDTNLCIKSREWNQETALQLKSAHFIMCFDSAACPTAHKWCQLDAVQVGDFDARRQLAATAAADAAAAAHL